MIYNTLKTRLIGMFNIHIFAFIINLKKFNNSANLKIKYNRQFLCNLTIKKIIYFFFFLSTLIFCTSVQAGVDEYKESVPRVTIIWQDDYGQKHLLAWGSGFAISNNVLVTNYHVIAPIYDYQNAAIWVVYPQTAGGGVYNGYILDTHPNKDIALVQFQGPGLPFLTLTDKKVDSGQQVFAFGYPGEVDEDLGHNADQIVSPSNALVTSGNVSGYSNDAPDASSGQTIIHSATITHGNSGGPLLDECGRVIGLNTWAHNSRGYSIDTTDLIPIIHYNKIKLAFSADKCLSAVERAKQIEAEAKANADLKNKELEEAVNSVRSAQEATELKRSEIEKASNNLNNLIKYFLVGVGVLIIGAIFAGYKFFKVIKEHRDKISATPEDWRIESTYKNNQILPPTSQVIDAEYKENEDLG